MSYHIHDDEKCRHLTSRSNEAQDRQPWQVVYSFFFVAPPSLSLADLSRIKIVALVRERKLTAHSPSNELEVAR